jgi:cytochrome c oxidase assembly factor CtaG/ferredoxin
MNPALDAFLRSWPFEPWLLISLLSSAAIYLRGWLVLRSRDPHRWTTAQPAAFLGGLAVLFLALASPIEPFAALLLQVHMVQHVLLMMVVPPLLWLGEPFFPLLRGLPREIRIVWIAPLFRSRFLRSFFTAISHPKIALPLFVAATWGWHIPAAYELALRSARWHYVQHVCFISTGLLFWYPVIRPYPSRPSWSPWVLLPYLVLADVQNTVLAALLTFSDKLLYPYYAQVPRIGGLSALDDQSAAGLIMWVPGSLAYLAPLFVIGVRMLLQGTHVERARARTRPSVSYSHPPIAASTLSDRLSLPILGQQSREIPTGFDILRVPVLGHFLRWRHARFAAQVPLLLLAAVVVYDGLRGPPVGAMNLAGVLPWIHWRGLLIFGLLAMGNVFCMACPFTLPRKLASRWRPATRKWPAWLRNKWLSVLLLIVFLWAYEAFSLWNSPWWTAWIVLAYFATAFVVDSFFQGASFCKYVCPIGQFNFVQSLISPWEVKVRQPALCTSCRTKDCIQGSDSIPGCQLHLYQPHKSSNMDCTFCLDCVHACPHENVGILAVIPGRELWRDPMRSGVGRFGRRSDLAALCVVLVFGAFTNAAGMTGPLVAWQNQLVQAAGLRSPLLATTVFYAAALLALPGVLVGGATLLSRRWGGLAQNWTEIAARYSMALVPLGFSMWLAHYSFHFLTSYATVVPTTQRLAADLGLTMLGPPKWSCACCIPATTWLVRSEIVSLDIGLLASLYVGYRVALSQTPNLGSALKALAPWATLMLVLFGTGIWIVYQPMQMRGTMPLAG